MLTLILCQLRSGPYIKSHGRPHEMGSDTLTMQRFSRFSLYASAAYCNMPAGYPHEPKPDEDTKLATKNSLIQSQLGLHPSKIYPYVQDIHVLGVAKKLEHFVAVDDTYRRVVLTFKGTNDIHAVLKNLDASYFEAEVWGGKYQVHLLMGAFDSQTQRHWNDTTDQTDLVISHNLLEQPGAHFRAPRIVIALRQCDLDVRKHSCLTKDYSAETDSTKIPSKKVPVGWRCVTEKRKYPCQSQAIGVKVAAEDIKRDSFNARLSVWGDGQMGVAGCAWMAYQADDKRFRSGVEKMSCRYKTNPKLEIKFESAFGHGETPIVLAWISGFQMVYEPGTWYLNVSVDEKTITNAGFTLELKQGEKTILNQGLFSWLAFLPSEGVAGGRTEPIPLGKSEDTLEPRELKPEELMPTDPFEESIRKKKTFSTPETIPFGKTMKGVAKENVMVGISAIDVVWENEHEPIPTGMSFSYRLVKINTKPAAVNAEAEAEAKKKEPEPEPEKEEAEKKEAEKKEAEKKEAEGMELLLGTWWKSKIRSAEMSWVVVAVGPTICV
ncbi:hypothetical protein DFP73DRAFT_618422 [Morchella snyderi]|nr:hypothetical protein DFP73DRAFT_618422 [Morchella snyderi]